MGRHVRAGSSDIWTEQVGAGPDVLLIGGAGDTVESWSFQLDGLADRLRDRGLPVELRVYPDARHEVFNETNRDEVTGDLLAWLGARVGGRPGPGTTPV